MSSILISVSILSGAAIDVGQIIDR